MSAEEPVWRAWVTAHHAVGCGERHKPVEACRYYAAHVKTAKIIAEDLASQGWKLCKNDPHEPDTIPLFGDL